MRQQGPLTDFDYHRHHETDHRCTPPPTRAKQQGKEHPQWHEQRDIRPEFDSRVADEAEAMLPAPLDDPRQRRSYRTVYR